MNKFYLLRWWLVTICLVSPLLIFVWSLMGGQMYELIILAIPFAILYSIPTVLAVWLLSRFLTELNPQPWMFKALLIGLALMGITITFHMIKGTLAPILMIIYSLSVVISSIFIQFHPHDKS